MWEESKLLCYIHLLYHWEISFLAKDIYKRRQPKRGQTGPLCYNEIMPQPFGL